MSKRGNLVSQSAMRLLADVVRPILQEEKNRPDEEVPRDRDGKPLGPQKRTGARIGVNQQTVSNICGKNQKRIGLERAIAIVAEMKIADVHAYLEDALCAHLGRPNLGSRRTAAVTLGDDVAQLWAHMATEVLQLSDATDPVMERRIACALAHLVGIEQDVLAEARTKSSLPAGTPVRGWLTHIARLRGRRMLKTGR